MDDLNDSKSWVQGFRCYEQFKDVDDINNIMLWARDSRCYEQVKVVDDMNDSRSHELRPLDAINNLGLWIIWTILGFEHKALNVMNNSGL